MKTKNKIIICISIFAILIGIVIFSIFNNNSEYVSFKDFYSEFENEKISAVFIKDDKLEFKMTDDNKTYYTENPNYDDFEKELLLNNVSVETSSTEDTLNMVFNLLLFTIIICFIILFAYKYYETNNKIFKIVKHTNVKFDDIAGMSNIKKDMKQIIDILNNPKKYKSQGIRQIKGIILEGPPGNGKTLFAKALAEEMNINFIATKGADFQSPVMSMGAQKIKQLFKKAKKHKPCIIFIDEFDSIGEKRNYAGTGVDKENNRIVTAMLNEMDGFETGEGILVIGATNSIRSLDPALIRPGRFDLKYNIPNPDIETRLELIDLYTKKKKLSHKINKSKLADCFENLSCSSIETLLNEATLEAMLENKETISIENIINASKKTNCRINLDKI